MAGLPQPDRDGEPRCEDVCQRGHPADVLKHQEHLPVPQRLPSAAARDAHRAVVSHLLPPPSGLYTMKR